MKREKLAEILTKHKQWVQGEDGGVRADLRRADLCEADLCEANLCEADLREANLRGADLRRADLRRADLRGADLRRADLCETIYEDINWLAFIGIVPNTKGKARAYKLINSDGEGIFRGGINYLNATTFQVKEINTDINQQCSYGINLATLQWCIFNRQDQSNKLLLMEFNIKDAICPLNSDGKFRVKKCQKIGECDWKGNQI